ncbi:MAG: hypothetical protein ACRBFS_21540 [Aureispira sp.]
MKFSIIILVILFTILTVKAQDDYIIDQFDRKITGKVLLSTPAVNSVEINFKDKEGSIRKYRPDEIKEWSIGNLIYESKLFAFNSRAGVWVYMLRHTPKNGKCQVYEFYNATESVGYTEMILERDNQMEVINYGRFYKQLTTYFKDHESLAEEIGKKKYKKKELLTIVEIYNAWREEMWK